MGTISEYVDYENGYYESTHSYDDSKNNNFQIIEKGKNYPNYFSEEEIFVRLYKWNSAQGVFEEINNTDFL